MLSIHIAISAHGVKEQKYTYRDLAVAEVGPPGMVEA